jgi:hypothetical protein
VYFHVIQLGSSDRQAKLAEVCRRVNASIVSWTLQSLMDLCVMAQQLRNPSESDFDLVTAGTCSGKRHKAHGGEEFVADPVVQLMQQYSFLWD